VLAGINAGFAAPELVAIAGPNGAGKSTMLGIMSGLRGEYEGRCVYRGTEVVRWRRRLFAREVSFVPQNLRLEFPFTAEEVVLMGRTAHENGLFESPDDFEAVRRAMRTTDTLAFRERDFRSLSGGEKQRVILAAALAQEPRTLLLDEPTTFLDIRHQLAIYELLRELCRTRGLLIVAVTHDLNLAAAYADRIVMLNRGRIVIDAPPERVISAKIIADVFGVAAEISRTRAGRPWIVYGS